MNGDHDVEVVFELVQELFAGPLSVHRQGPFSTGEFGLCEEAFLGRIRVLTDFGRPRHATVCSGQP